MREVLFRGKRIDTGEWVYGYLFKSWNDCYICWGMENGKISNIPVIPATLGQYTGLDDKNGVKIFEGDIHEYGGSHFEIIHGTYIHEMTYEECYGWHMYDRFENTGYDLGRAESYINIIGNIHDNPELMENKE